MAKRLDMREVDFLEAWDSIGIQPTTRAYREVLAGYTGSTRHYHTFDHVDDCLQQLEGMFTIILGMNEGPTYERTMRLALWYHDVVYDVNPNASNEFDSAVMFLKHASYIQTPIVKRVISLIMATTHQAVYRTQSMESYMQDIDLSGFGQPWEVTRRNSENVRKEFAHIPSEDYARGRITILESFLSRSSIYNNFFFRDKYEKQARENIREEIQQLNAGGLV